MNAASPNLSPGERVGDRYRIDAVIGRGGMSTVYRATHLERGHEVAVKILSPAALAMSAVVTRLRREALATSRLRSEHVVRVHEVGELPGGVPYLVMEHLAGTDLSVALARRGPLPVAFACTCIMQACEALAEAHAQGIVHRDLKPANLFLLDRPDGAPFVKLLDFGISRQEPQRGVGPLTDPGTVLGTPAYMAPEQMEGAEPLDGRVDVWALGTILYELLAGRPRCRGDSLAHVFVSVVRSPPPRAGRLRTDVPRALDAVIARCLEVEPHRRWANVAELARALAPFVPDGAEAASRVSRALGALGRRRARELRDVSRVLAAAAFALAIGGAIGFFAGATEESPPPPEIAPMPLGDDAGLVPVTIATPAPP